MNVGNDNDDDGNDKGDDDDDKGDGDDDNGDDGYIYLCIYYHQNILWWFQ